MDEQRRGSAFRWGLVAKSGYCGHMLTPRAGEPVWVDEAFLLDPADAGQGAVDARVEIGTRDLLLASLSAENPHVVLQTPVLLDDEFCFYVTRQGGDPDLDAADDDGVAVFFRGIVDALGDIEEEEEKEEGEEALSSEDEDDEENHEEESEGTDTEDVDDAMSSDQDTASSGDEEEESVEVGGRAATSPAVSGTFAFIYLVTFIMLAMYL